MKLSYLQAEAQEMEMAKISRAMSSIGSPKHEEKLREAAAVHIKLGNVQRYCELMAEVGEVSMNKGNFFYIGLLLIKPFFL